jgi:hypothetical protein
MITVWTSHSEIFDIDQIVVDIIAEYQIFGRVDINMNEEGPSCEAIGLYRILDNICEKFKFDKSKFLITTWNPEELHPEYKILFVEQPWITLTKKAIAELGYSSESFHCKDVAKNLFGCLYNVPSWDRLCLLAHIKFQTKHSSLLGCNLTFNERAYNTVYLDQLIDTAPNELYTVVDYIKTQPTAVCGIVAEKPVTKTALNEPVKFYNDFFVDIVAETYSAGLTFFITEKTIRPIYTLTPFITFGPQGFLANLRSRYGIKTFGQWWDESYDDLQAYDRIKGMYKVIDYLDSLTTDEHIQMYREMQGVLDHNYEIIKNL